MLRNKWIAMLAIAALAVGCGSSNSTSSGGSASVPDHQGANTPITSSNAAQVMTETSAALNGALGRVLAAVAASKQAVPAAAKSVSNVVVNGAHSGKVTIKSGDFDINGTSQSLKADVEFDDFSDDGQVWIGGPVNIEIESSLSGFDPNNPTGSLGGLSLSFKQKGDLAFSGKYKGSLSMDLSVSLSGGVPSVSGSVTVDGNKINLN